MNARSQEPFELTGRKVILGFVAFFAVLICVQAAFITIAITTHTGLVSEQPYRKGLKYGDRIAAAERQKQRGWRETITVSQKDNTLSLLITDKDGQPISGLKIAGLMARPVNDNEDVTLSFRNTDEGAYQSKIPVGLAGAFIVDIEASDRTPGGEIVWRARKRLWLKP